MAMRNEFPLHAVHRGLTIVAGSFAGNAASNPNNALNTGVGFSVTRTGVGLFRIQLGSSPTVPAGLLPATDKYITLVASSFQMETSAALELLCTLKAQSPSTGIFDIEIRTAGATGTELATTGRVHFILMLTDSAALPVRG